MNTDALRNQAAPDQTGLEQSGLEQTGPTGALSTVVVHGAVAEQVDAIRHALGADVQVIEAHAAPAGSDSESSDCLALHVSPELVIDATWLTPLLRAAHDVDGPVGGLVIDPDGRLVHAGAVESGDGLRVFAHREPPEHAPLIGSARFARLLPPFAQPIDAAAPDLGVPLGLLRPDIVATASAAIDLSGDPMIVSLQRLVPDAVMVVGSTGDADTDADVLRTLDAGRPVIWRRPWNTAPTPVDGVHEFDAAEHETDSLIAAFGAARVLFLDDAVLADPAAFQHTLRAAPGLETAALRGHVRPELATRCASTVSLDHLTEWTEMPQQAHTPCIPAIDEVDAAPGLVSVVIPVHGLWELTERCIATLRASTDRDLEIIVVDDASPDDTGRRLAERDDLIVVTNERNVGFPTSVNRGIDASTGEFVCVLNNDTEPVDGWLDELLRVLELEGTAMVGPRSNRISGLQQIPNGPSLDHPDEAHGWARSWAGERRGSSWRTDRLVGFALLARRRTFEELGGFDEGFGRGNFEDDELSGRIVAAGLDLRVADGAVVLHHGSATFAAIGDDYLATLAAASRHHRPADQPTARSPIACLVLSDGDVDAAERTVWSVLGLSTRILVAERGPVDALALRLARAARLGVEVMAVDWTVGDGAAAALEHLDGAERIFMCSAGERLEVADWGTARAEIEQSPASRSGRFRTTTPPSTPSAVPPTRPCDSCVCARRSRWRPPPTSPRLLPRHRHRCRADPRLTRPSSSQ